MVKKATAEPYLYSDRRVELPAEPVGAVPYEASQLAEILAGVRTLLGRSDRIMEDAQRQIQGTARRMQAMLDASQNSHRNTIAELEDLKAQLRTSISGGPEAVAAWSAVARFVDTL